MSKSVAEKKFTQVAINTLVGHKVTAVRYMTDDEAQQHGWSARPLILIFDDGTWVYAASDDEGNDGGALFGTDRAGEGLTFPVMR